MAHPIMVTTPTIIGVSSKSSWKASSSSSSSLKMAADAAFLAAAGSARLLTGAAAAARAGDLPDRVATGERILQDLVGEMVG